MPKPTSAKLPKRKLNYGAKSVGVVVGHRTCVPRGRHRVPREMGWLWTADLPGLQFDPHWRPGAVPRTIFKLRDRSRQPPQVLKSVPSKIRAKRKVALGAVHSSESMPQALVVKRKGGNLQVVLRELQNIKDRHVSEYPYNDDELPMTFKILEETPEQTARRERSRTKKAALHMRELCRQSLWNICQEVHRKIDKKTLCKMAADKNECVCLFLESQIVNNLVNMYLNQGERPECGANKEQAFLDKLMKSVMEDQKKTMSSPSDETLFSSDEEWRVEFTPPCAFYNPHARKRTAKDMEVQAKKIDVDSKAPTDVV